MNYSARYVLGRPSLLIDLPLIIFGLTVGIALRLPRGLRDLVGATLIDLNVEGVQHLQGTLTLGPITLALGIQFPRASK